MYRGEISLRKMAIIVEILQTTAENILVKKKKHPGKVGLTKGVLKKEKRYRKYGNNYLRKDYRNTSSIGNNKNRNQRRYTQQIKKVQSE